MSSTYLLYKIGLDNQIGQSNIHCSSEWHKNKLAKNGPNGEPIATPSICL